MSHQAVDVSIIVVTFESELDLAVCLESALTQEGVTTEVVVVENASTDGTRSIIEGFGPRVRLLAQAENVGFAEGMNIGIDATGGRYVLALNPDCRLAPRFAATLVARLDGRPDMGSATGRILRADGPELLPTGALDSTGIRFTASGRHFDRGAGEAAEGRYLAEEEVFGVTGAAGFYRREALQSVRISTGIFDADFFAYREDADLAWRLRRAGWRCLYVPDAIAYHRRANLPERRRSMSASINYHSVKNRFLLRINNQTRAEALRHLVPTLTRDMVVVAGCVVRERSSLPAFGWLWRERRRLMAKRREIASLSSPPRATK